MQVIAILGTVHIPGGFLGVKGNKAGTEKNNVGNKGTRTCFRECRNKLNVDQC